MQAVFDRQSLVDALTVASAAVPSKSPKEVLQYVKLVASGDTATLTGTDLELGVRVMLTAEASRSGAVLLPKRVLAILKELRDETVTLKASKSGLELTSQSGKFHLATEPPDDFPPVGETPDEPYCEIDADEFRQAVERTVFASDVTATRYALGGVCFDPTDGLTFAATDGRRLATVALSVSPPGNWTSVEVVPQKALLLASRSAEETVRVWLEKSTVAFQSGNVTVVSRLVEGRFPKWREVVPKTHKHQMQFLVEPLARVLRLASQTTSEESRGVAFQVRSGELQLKTQAANVGTAELTLPVAYDGAEIGWTVDPRYVLDFLKVLPDEETVRLDVTDSESALLFEVDGYQYVLMPIAKGA